MVSLILTVFDESETIEGLLSDVISQSLRPAELVVVDGGSTDGTPSLVRSYERRLLSAGIVLTLAVRPGLNIAQGRNLAISQAMYDIICVTDAGCRLHTDWVRNISQPLTTNEADLVGGFFRPLAPSDFQRTVARLTVADSPPQGFLPSSRSVAFARSLWRRVGGYPEWLRWGEDTLFNEDCLSAGARYKVVADALVYWEVRRSYREVLLQYYRYAVGDGLRMRLSLSYAANCGIVYVSLLLAFFSSPAWLALLPLYILAIMSPVISRLEFRELPRACGLTLGIRTARLLGWHLGVMARARSQILRGGKP